MALVAATPPLAFLRNCLQALVSGDSNPMAPINRPNSSTAFLDLIRSQENARHWNFLDVSFPGKGKIGEGNFPKVYVEFKKPVCEEDCGDLTDFGACSTAVKTQRDIDRVTHLELTVNEGCGFERRLSKAQFAELCKDDAQAEVRELLQELAGQIRRNVSKNGLANLYAQVGILPDGVTNSQTDPQGVTVVTQQGNIFPAGFAKIKGTYRKNKYFGKVYSVGSDMLATYFDVQAYQGGGQNATGTVNPFTQGDFTYDDNLDTIVQTALSTVDSYGITLPEGAMGFYAWNEYTGINEESHENHLETTIEIDGMTYDYFLTYDICDKEWVMGLKLHYCWSSIPDSMYCDGESYKWLWKFECGPIDCDTIKSC